MLWINYLDTGSERGDASLEGSLRMEGCRGGAEEEEEQSEEGWFPQHLHKPPFLCEERVCVCGAEVSLSETVETGFIPRENKKYIKKIKVLKAYF